MAGCGQRLIGQPRAELDVVYLSAVATARKRDPDVLDTVLTQHRQDAAEVFHEPIRLPGIARHPLLGLGRARDIHPFVDHLPNLRRRRLVASRTDLGNRQRTILKARPAQRDRPSRPVHEHGRNRAMSVLDASVIGRHAMPLAQPLHSQPPAGLDEVAGPLRRQVPLVALDVVRLVLVGQLLQRGRSREPIVFGSPPVGAPAQADSPSLVAGHADGVGHRYAGEPKLQRGDRKPQQVLRFAGELVRIQHRIRGGGRHQPGPDQVAQRRGHLRGQPDQPRFDSRRGRHIALPAR